MLSTMALDSLFLSLLISRPAVEKIRFDGMDVEGKERTLLAIIEILEYFNSFFLAPGQLAPKPVPPGTIPPRHFAQNFERDCSLKSSGTIRSKTNLRIDSPIFIIYIYILKSSLEILFSRTKAYSANIQTAVYMEQEQNSFSDSRESSQKRT